MKSKKSPLGGGITILCHRSRDIAYNVEEKKIEVISSDIAILKIGITILRPLKTRKFDTA